MAIQVEELVKEFTDKKKGSVRAVDRVTFQCPDGIIFGLLGLNGAGKTTILRIICTVLRAGSGKVTVGGFDVEKQAGEVRRRIGFLPAESGLYGHFTVRETLWYFGRLGKYPEDRLGKRIDALIERFGMNDFANNLCKGLSSGMKQKVCLARAVVHDPPIVIFDEPTNSLDVITRISVHDFIRECRDQGKCIILSTHIMSEADKLCDEIGILHKGRLLALGSLDELRADSGKHYLEDVFVSYVGESANEMG